MEQLPGGVLLINTKKIKIRLRNYYYKIKDDCRAGLIRHLQNACLKIPKNQNADILDIGCGTGLPTLWFADNFPGTITAIDIDKDALAFLQKKIIERNLQSKIKTINLSFSEFKSEFDSFDIIVAEGFLNVIGFEKGFKGLIKILKKGGYLIIHDEYKNHDKKCDFIRKSNCKIITILYLDEITWWNDYYRQLEAEINKIKDKKLLDMFSSDIKEIENYKAASSLFRSMYYVVSKL